MNSYEVEFLNKQDEVEVGTIHTNETDVDEVMKFFTEVMGLEVITLVRCQEQER